MKKKMLSLALALVMCLSLLPATALAADPSAYADDAIRITNVIEHKTESAAFTCVAPVTITPGDAFINAKSCGISVGKFPADAEVNEENYNTYEASDTIEWESMSGKTVTLEEPGCYLVAFDVEYAEDGYEYAPYLVIVQDGSGNNEGSGNDGDSDKDATPSDPAGGFTDVSSSDYFAAPVQWAVEKDITSGTSDTTFSPSQNCTVAQILTFLWRANGSPESTASNPFTDISSSDYFYNAALWAAEKEMVSGETFGGNNSCTRSMAVTYMWKAVDSPAAEAASFTDVPADADYAQAVAWAVEQGVTSGTSDTTFSPNSVCTRAQIVTFLYRALAE